MAPFPALIPVERSYTFGLFPITEVALFAGGPIRFRHGSDPHSYTLTLRFAPLTPEQAQLIREHYRTQQGGYYPFPLSPEVWTGHTSPANLTPSTTLWRYADSIQEEHLPTNTINITIKLTSTY